MANYLLSVNAETMELPEDVLQALPFSPNTIENGAVVGDNLVLTKRDGSTTVAGNVRGPEGPAGPNTVPTETAINTVLDSRLDPYTETLGQFELQPLWAFGHSWQANNSNATAGARWFERVMKRLYMGASTVKAVSGRTIGDNVMLALAGANAWTTRTKALVVAGCTINDLVRFSGTDASRRGYIHAWRTLLSILTANAVVAANTRSFVYSPDWTKETVVGSASDVSGLVRNSTGGVRWKTTTVGRYFEFTFTGTAVDVYLVAQIAGAGLVTFTEGATARGTLDLRSTVAQETPAIHRIRGLSAGTHTIRGTLTSGSSLTVDGHRIPSTAPVPVLVYGEPPLIWNEYGDPAVFLPLMESFKTELAAIAAEFPTVRYLDLNQAGWDPATMLTVDGLHPNDAGCAWIASRAIERLATFPYLVGLNKTAASYPDAYVPPTGPTIPSGGVAGDDSAGPAAGFADNFNRADNSSSLGVTSTGSLPYEILGTATWGIEANHAYVSSLTSTTTMAVIDVGNADLPYKVTLAALPSPANMLAPLRVQDIDNYIGLSRFSSTDLRYRLIKVVGGTATIVGTVAATKLIEVGDVIEVTFSGPAITVKVNGVTIITASETTFQTASKRGIYAGASSYAALRWDDLSSLPA